MFRDLMLSLSKAEAVDEDYIKRSSLISQVQDLFPDLGDGFIEVDRSTSHFSDCLIHSLNDLF